MEKWEGSISSDKLDIKAQNKQLKSLTASLQMNTEKISSIYQDMK